MSITREQVADLQRGDVVELVFASGSVIRGPLTEDRHVGGLDIAEVGWTVRQQDGYPGYGLGRHAETITVVSRAPRPLYVNSDRTEPWAGDIARDGDGDAWRYWDIGWCIADKASRNPAEADIRRYGPLRLLWDGQTGQVVPS